MGNGTANLIPVQAPPPRSKTPATLAMRARSASQHMVPPKMSPAVRLGAAIAGSTTVDGFAIGKWEVSKANRNRLAWTAKTILAYLAQYPASTVLVAGHTDAVGKEEANQSLGQKRAESIQAVLVEMGVPAVAIRTESKGQTDLVVKTQVAEPRNRRVEVHFRPSGLLTKFYPGESVGVDEGPSQTPAPPDPVPVGEPVINLPPDFSDPIPTAPTKRDKWGDAAKKYKPGGPEVPVIPVEVRPDQMDRGIGGPFLPPMVDILGVRRVWNELNRKTSKRRAPQADVDPAVIVAIGKDPKYSLIPPEAKGGDPGRWANEEAFARDLATKMDAAQKQNYAEISVTLSSAYRAVKDTEPILAAIGAMVKKLRDAREDHASSIRRVTVRVEVGGEMKIWGYVSTP